MPVFMEAKEGWPCNRESFFEFNRHSTEVPTFPFLAFLVPGCNRQARALPLETLVMTWRLASSLSFHSSSLSTICILEIPFLHDRQTIEGIHIRRGRSLHLPDWFMTEMDGNFIIFQIPKGLGTQVFSIPFCPSCWMVIPLVNSWITIVISSWAGFPLST